MYWHADCNSSFHECDSLLPSRRLLERRSHCGIGFGPICNYVHHHNDDNIVRRDGERLLTQRDYRSIVGIDQSDHLFVQQDHDVRGRKWKSSFDGSGPLRRAGHGLLRPEWQPDDRDQSCRASFHDDHLGACRAGQHRCRNDHDLQENDHHHNHGDAIKALAMSARASILLAMKTLILASTVLAAGLLAGCASDDNAMPSSSTTTTTEESTTASPMSPVAPNSTSTTTSQTTTTSGQ